MAWCRTPHGGVFRAHWLHACAQHLRVSEERTAVTALKAVEDWTKSAKRAFAKRLPVRHLECCRGLVPLCGGGLTPIAVCCGVVRVWCVQLAKAERLLERCNNLPLQPGSLATKLAASVEETRAWLADTKTAVAGTRAGTLLFPPEDEEEPAATPAVADAADTTDADGDVDMAVADAAAVEATAPAASTPPAERAAGDAYVTLAQLKELLESVSQLKVIPSQERTLSRAVSDVEDWVVEAKEWFPGAAILATDVVVEQNASDEGSSAPGDDATPAAGSGDDETAATDAGSGDGDDSTQPMSPSRKSGRRRKPKLPGMAAGDTASPAAPPTASVEVAAPAPAADDVDMGNGDGDQGDGGSESTQQRPHVDHFVACMKAGMELPVRRVAVLVSWYTSHAHAGWVGGFARASPGGMRVWLCRSMGRLACSCSVKLWRPRQLGKSVRVTYRRSWASPSRSSTTPPVQWSRRKTLSRCGTAVVAWFAVWPRW